VLHPSAELLQSIQLEVHRASAELLQSISGTAPELIACSPVSPYRHTASVD
jgi:hypothetical protein